MKRNVVKRDFSCTCRSLFSFKNKVVLFSCGQVYKQLGNMNLTSLLLRNMIHLNDTTKFITAAICAVAQQNFWNEDMVVCCKGRSFLWLVHSLGNLGP